MGVITHFMDLCPSNFIRVSRAKRGLRALFGRLWCLYSPTWESVNSHNFGGSVLYALPQNGGNGLKDGFLILGNGQAVEKLEGLTFVWSRAKTVEGFSGARASSLRSSAVLFDTSTPEYITNLPIILPRRSSYRIYCCPWLSSAWCFLPISLPSLLLIYLSSCGNIQFTSSILSRWKLRHFGPVLNM